MTKLPMASSLGEETFALHLRAHGIHMDREVVFCEGRRWRFDFADTERKIAVEVEGGTWGTGRHTSGTGFESDCVKYNTAQLLGWSVFRFTTGMVTRGEAIQTVLHAYGLES